LKKMSVKKCSQSEFAKLDFYGFHVRLRGEIKHGIQRRHEFSLRKLSFCVALLGLGALNKIPIGSAQILSLTSLLYLVPLVAIAFDLYIVAEDFRIKHAGEYLAKEESGSGPAERYWESFVKKHDNPFAPWAFFIVTVILLIGAILLLLKASHNILFISIWGGVLLSTEIYLLWYSLHLRSRWEAK
jgi:hypothetical protein